MINALLPVFVSATALAAKPIEVIALAGDECMLENAPLPAKVKLEELAGWEKWRNLDEVEVVMATHWRWKRVRIAGIAAGVISFQVPENAARSMRHLDQPGTPHWYENAYEFLDAEGEFYLNTKADALYCKPRKGEDMSSVEMIAPQMDALFHVHGTSDAGKAHDLVFDGITFGCGNRTLTERAVLSGHAAGDLVCDRGIAFRPGPQHSRCRAVGKCQQD